ncbi:MAG TPA: hypothetical protein VHO50_10565, partial [Bacteroidales bacterium]|nr:hypothetical protein [Bacteroidales bacterium]
MKDKTNGKDCNMEAGEERLKVFNWKRQVGDWKRSGFTAYVSVRHHLKAVPVVAPIYLPSKDLRHFVQTLNPSKNRELIHNPH